MGILRKLAIFKPCRKTSSRAGKAEAKALTENKKVDEPKPVEEPNTEEEETSTVSEESVKTEVPKETEEEEKPSDEEAKPEEEPTATDEEAKPEEEEPKETDEEAKPEEEEPIATEEGSKPDEDAEQSAEKTSDSKEDQGSDKDEQGELTSKIAADDDIINVVSEDTAVAVVDKIDEPETATGDEEDGDAGVRFDEQNIAATETPKAKADDQTDVFSIFSEESTNTHLQTAMVSVNKSKKALKDWVQEREDVMCGALWNSL